MSSSRAKSSLIYFCLCLSVVLSAPLISSPWGTIRGTDKTATNGKIYHGYYGIPFARPPTGQLRFKPPLPSANRSGIFNASDYGPICIQPLSPKEKGTQQQSEDCLSLNVFVPAPSTPNRDVMVWIHGGGFAQGGAPDYEPWKIVTDGDVIVVVIQYRLSIFGFLTTGGPEMPGNAALLDQALALKWVHHNIRSFGGDPDSVTVFGESAGGASTSLHTLSPVSKGLFKRFIMQSGSATAFWADDKHPRRKFETVVSSVECSSRTTDKQKVECLENVPVDKLRVFASLNFGPTVDGEFMPDHPMTLLQNTSYLEDLGFFQLEGLIGVNNNEGAVLLMAANGRDIEQNTTTFTDALQTDGYYDNFLLPMILNGTLGYFDSVLADVIKYEYTAPRTNNATRLKLNSVLQTYGDVAFIAPAVSYARVHSSGKHSPGKTFLYYFNYYPSFTFGTKFDGMSHGFDLQFLFGLDPKLLRLGGSGTFSSQDNDVSALFVKFITEFGKTGNISNDLRSKLGQSWKTFTPEDEVYLSFGANLTLGRNLEARRVSFWLDLIPKLMDREISRSQQTTCTISAAHSNRGQSLVIAHVILFFQVIMVF